MTNMFAGAKLAKPTSIRQQVNQRNFISICSHTLYKFHAIDRIPDVNMYLVCYPFKIDLGVESTIGTVNFRT